MNKKINISIPAGLSPEKEIFEIGKKLTQRALSGNSRQVDHKRIGNEINISRLKTEIHITRIVHDLIEFVDCNVCGCSYQNNLFKPVYQNYGGKTKLIKVCSEACQNIMIDICGEGRASKTRKGLIPVRLFR